MPLIVKFQILEFTTTGLTLSAPIDSPHDAIEQAATILKENLYAQVEALETGGEEPPRIVGIMTVRIDEATGVAQSTEQQVSRVAQMFRGPVTVDHIK